jgi:hypothetical protein
VREESQEQQARQTALTLAAQLDLGRTRRRAEFILTMKMLYLAYGLRLSCSFPLPGMRPAAEASDGLPELAIDLRDPAELERAWSGAGGEPEWRGRQGDGRELTIERGSDGALRFSYGELARFLLDPQLRRLDCAPADSSLDWQRVLIGKVIPAISVMLGYEGLHAAAVESPVGVVAIMAPSGAGKSTLALELLRRGWPLFADDVLTLSKDGDGVRAHPGTPHMNVALEPPEGIDPQTLGETLAILAGERWLAASNTSDERTRPVRLLCLLERGPELALEMHALPASPLALAPYTLGLSSDPERLRSRFDLYADLTGSAALVRLTAGPDDRPAALAELLERSLARQPGELAGAPR